MINKSIEPIMFDEAVYEDNSVLIKKICFWEKCSLSEDRETHLLRVLFPGSKTFNLGCKGTYALSDGRRATEKDFYYIGSFNEGLAKIASEDKKYGFIDKDMNIVISPKYENVDDFKNGIAIATISDEVSNKKTFLILDKKGNEYFFEKEYKKIAYNHDGMFRVSDHGDIELAFHSDYEEYAGVWGYADSTGKEIIKPQYIYAFDFANGYALVCKGEWTKYKKCDNKYITRKYWTETELWGIIDKTGKEVVPFIFDEIKYFDCVFSSYNFLQAHYGGWEEGKWGIINYSGEWVVEPIFEDLGYEFIDDAYIGFYKEDKWSSDNVPVGIYSIKEHRVLFEPQFLDFDIFDDGTIKVELYDEKLGRNKEIIIDRNGKVLLDSQYTSIYKKDDMFEVHILDNNGKYLTGLVDKNGKEILPCKYEINFDGILFDQKRIIYKVGGRCGIKNFDDEIIIPPEYASIGKFGNKFYKVGIGGQGDVVYEEKYRLGLIKLDGKIVLPIEFKSILKADDIIIAEDDTGTTLYRIRCKEEIW